MIDLQKGIVAGDKAHPVPDIIANAASLKAAFRAAQLSVVVLINRMDIKTDQIVRQGLTSGLISLNRQ